jgi:hypothetical protein
LNVEFYPGAPVQQITSPKLLPSIPSRINGRFRDVSIVRTGGHFFHPGSARSSRANEGISIFTSERRSSRTSFSSVFSQLQPEKRIFAQRFYSEGKFGKINPVLVEKYEINGRDHEETGKIVCPLQKLEPTSAHLHVRFWGQTAGLSGQIRGLRLSRLACCACGWHTALVETIWGDDGVADGTVMCCVACVHLEELDDDMWRYAPGSVGEMRQGSCFCAFPVDGRAIVTGLMLAGRSNTWCDL